MSTSNKTLTKNSTNSDEISSISAQMDRPLANSDDDMPQLNDMENTDEVQWDEDIIEDYDCPIAKENIMKSVLEEYNFFETEDQLQHQAHILNQINELFWTFTKCIGLTKNMSEDAAVKLGGKVYCFGAYTLGVQEKYRPIEVLCVAPRIASREEFFTVFIEYLRLQPNVTGCIAIEDVMEPVIQCTFEVGIKVNLYYASLILSEITEDFNINDDNLISQCLTESCFRSLGRCQNTYEILALVPNLMTFRLALRVIILWANTCKIYSDVPGQFGCVAWAILVAHMCQLHSRADAVNLVEFFFIYYSRWEWSIPVVLKKPNQPRSTKRDNSSIMPIITPAFPSQSCTYEISKSTKAIVLHELKRAMDLVNNTMHAKFCWYQLFEAPSFFFKYQHFLTIKLRINSGDQNHGEWCSLLKTEAELLLMELESNKNILVAQLYPEIVSDNGQAHLWFIGLDIECEEEKVVCLRETARSFSEQFIQDGVALGLNNDIVSLQVYCIPRNRLNEFFDTDILLRD